MTARPEGGGSVVVKVTVAGVPRAPRHERDDGGGPSFRIVAALNWDGRLVVDDSTVATPGRQHGPTRGLRQHRETSLPSARVRAIGMTMAADACRREVAAAVAVKSLMRGSANSRWRLQVDRGEVPRSQCRWGPQTMRVLLPAPSVREVALQIQRLETKLSARVMTAMDAWPAPPRRGIAEGERNVSLPSASGHEIGISTVLDVHSREGQVPAVLRVWGGTGRCRGGV